MLEELVENSKDVENSRQQIQEETIFSEDSTIEIESEIILGAESREKKPFLEPLKRNRFFLVRVLYHILRSIWIVAMVVGGFIAWIISLLFI
jgi:hypothetical protein